MRDADAADIIADERDIAPLRHYRCHYDADAIIAGNIISYLHYAISAIDTALAPLFHCHEPPCF